MTGGTVDKNHNPILHFTSYLLFHKKRLFSLSCLDVLVGLDYKF